MVQAAVNELQESKQAGPQISYTGVKLRVILLPQSQKGLY